MYVDELLDRSDELMHYGTPRHSGRYPWGSGERPFQGDNVSFKPSVKKYVVGRKTTRANKEAMDKAVRDIRDYLYTLTPIPDSDYKKLEKGINIPGDSNGYYEGKTVVAASTYNKFKRTLDKYENKVNKLDVVDDKTFTKLVMKQIDRKEALAGAISAAAVATPLMLLTMSDTDESNYIAELADDADDLAHYGTPRHSGRYPWGSGERPFQGDRYLALPAGSSYHSGHKSTRKSKASSGSAGASKSQNSNSTDSEEAQYKRNEERRKQQKHAADMADRARKIRKEDAKEKTDKAKAEEKEREDLEDAYWKEVTNMTNQLSSIRTHAKNLKAASKPVKDVTKKMSDQQLKELTDRLKLENSYLRELNTRQGYNARPDKVENLLGLLSDVSSMGRSASKVYRTANKQRKYL